MDKKKFFEPEVKMVELDDHSIVCASPVIPGTESETPGETGDNEEF